MILDCDGVLVDSEWTGAEAVSQLLAEYGVEMSPADLLDRFIGFTNDAMVPILEADCGVRLPSNFAALLDEREIAAAEIGSVVAIPGADEAVHGLRGLGLTMCVASNGPVEKMRATLTSSGLIHFFEGRLFTKAQVAQGKPAPDLFLFAASRMNAEPSKCIVVEDSTTGVTAGVTAGIRVLGYAGRGEGHADALAKAGATVFHDMRELPGLIARMM